MWAKYVKDTSGQFAIMFSVLAVFLLGLIGVAIDVTTIHSAKQKYQDLSDAAVLAAAISGLEDEDALQEIAENTVKSMTVVDDNYEVDLEIIDGNTISVRVGQAHDLMLFSAFRDPMKITASSDAPPLGKNKLNVSLVLDVTDSMKGSRISTLKVAATDLVESFESDDEDNADKVMFSIVPFSRYVKIPQKYETETWMDIEAPNTTCWNSLDLEASQAAGTCSPSSNESQTWSCTNPVYEEKCADVSWYGCVASRVEPWNKRPQVGAVQIPGFAGGGRCKSTMLPLTSDTNEMLATINGLETDNKTYIPAGLIWGWRSLTKEAPLIEADTADYDDRRQVMILMTDGKNSRSYGGQKDNGFSGVFHWPGNVNEANDLTEELCRGIKEDGIELYTVAFEVNDSNTLSLLQDCASDTAKYFDASNPAMLKEAFATIGEELAAIRISR